EEIGNFIEVYCQAPLEVLIERDVKGLYTKALRGEIENFTGISDPYEQPLQPEVICQTDKESPEESAAKILAKLEEMGYIPSACSGHSPKAQREEAGYSEEEEDLVEERLRALGYIT
ncbi:MAG: adenylyl-sulfate kinase, partial [Anaerolineae bacterium]